MTSVSIFTDAATSPKEHIAIGACLCIDQDDLPNYHDLSLVDLQQQLSGKVIFFKYESKKSTYSEISTVIDILKLIASQYPKLPEILLYTDCQSVCDLLTRRKDKLIKNNFVTSSGKTHPNADLYKVLFQITSQFKMTIFKIKGHDSKSNRVTIQEKIFSVVDKISRQKLRSVLV